MQSSQSDDGNMAEAAFSENGKYYSAISQDGRLRIWDTESNILKQEYTPDLHLSSPPVCLQWLSVAQNSGPSQTQKRDGRKSITSEEEYQCIALGTTSGKILIYSVTQAKVETVLQDGKASAVHRSCVTALDWHRKTGLYSCNKENHVLEWDLHSGTVRNKYNVNIDSKNKQASSVSAIKIVPHKKKTPARFLVTSSWQVRIWRLHNGDAEVIKCLGHNATTKAILALATLNDSCWLIEGSQNERLLSFWDVTVTDEHVPIMNGDDTPHKKKRKQSVSSAPVVSTPAYNFVLEDAPRQLAVSADAEGAAVRLRLAAATRSGVLHYYAHMLNGTSTKPIKPSVTIQIATGGAQPLPVQCTRLADSDVVLGYAQGAAVIFENITPDLKSKTQVLIRGEVIESKKKKNKQPNEVNKVRADASSDGVTYVEPLGGVSRKRPTPGGKVEVPMEQRLANLSVEPASRGAVSQNLTRLLMQGLHSKDKKLIQTVLENNKWAVARQTVSALPADCVAPLLEQLAELAASRTNQCASACTWLRATLQCHAALLLATAGAHADRVTRILAVFTHRRSHLCQLLNLKGRLELTMSQRESRDEPQTEQQPVLNYNDTSSDEEEMEVEKYHSGSEAGSEQLRWGGDSPNGGDSASGGDSDSDSAD